MTIEELKRNNISPEVTIIIPIYNSEKTIEACVNSLLTQSEENIEIILVNDGSTDNTAEICNKIPQHDDRVKVIHQKNSGVSSARNRGMQEAKGEWICFVDSDDTVEKEYVEYLKKHTRTKKTLPVCGMAIYHKAEVIYKGLEFSNFLMKDRTYEEYLALFGEWLMAPACGKMFRKEIIVENDLLFATDMSCGEDHLFVYSYVKYCDEIVFVDKNLYNYNACNGNARRRVFPLSGQIKIFEAKRMVLSEHCDNSNCVECYSARDSLKNLHARVGYWSKRGAKQYKELGECWNYYKDYFLPYLQQMEIFDKDDREWLVKNKDAVVEGRVRELYKKKQKEYQVSIKKQIGRKVKRYYNLIKNRK